MNLVNKSDLLNELPPYENKKVLLKYDQDVHDIVQEEIRAHKIFAPDYDLIYEYFDEGTPKEIAEHLFDFCKRNIRYDVETEEKQQIKSPSAILTQGYGDCKHYAAFIAGVLDAIKRNTNKNINWCYRFVSYDLLSQDVEHVFVVLKFNGQEYWVDPVLGSFNSRAVVPAFFIDKKINMALYRVSGIGIVPKLSIFNELQPNESGLVPTGTVTVPPVNDLNDEIQKLLYYGIIDNKGNYYPIVYNRVINSLAAVDAEDIVNSFNDFMASQRNSFLTMVSNNVNRYADIINRITINIDGSTDISTYNDIVNIWENYLGGNMADLMNAAGSGAGLKISGARIGDVISEVASGATSVINAFSGLFNAKTNAAAKLAQDQTAVELAALTNAQQQQNNPLSSLTQYMPYIIIAAAAYFILKK